MDSITKTIYSKQDFENVIIPSWQRWTNEKNVKDLSEAVSENGQLRDVLICELSDGTQYLTDGKHLKMAMIDKLKKRKVYVTIKKVKNQEEARQTFISFNTRGKSLSTIDFIVSYAGSGADDYKKFLVEVLGSPKSLKDADNAYGKLFTVPSLIKIFFGERRGYVKNGKATLIKEFDRVLNIVQFLDENYLKNAQIINHLSKTGTGMKLNAASIAPVLTELRKRPDLLYIPNQEILDMLIQYTFYHYNSMDTPNFWQDACASSIKSFLGTK